MINIIKKKKFIENLIKKSNNILDVGCGTGSSWWQYVDKNKRVTAFDYHFFPSIDNVPENFDIYKLDAGNFLKYYKNGKVYSLTKKKKTRINWKNSFDLVVADHIFEHVKDPELLMKGIYKALEKKGYVHVGIPDTSNITETIYQLIHKNKGGHIQQYTLESFVKIANKYGLKLKTYQEWEDDWSWLEKLYNPQLNQRQVNKEQIEYLCNVFRKELTLDKGYFYGWEIILQK